MRFIFSIIVASTILACGSGKEDVAYTPVADSLLVPLFTDALILNAAFADTHKSMKDSLSALYSDQLMKKYGITKHDFDTNMDRLHRDPERLDSILDAVIKHIDDLEAQFMDRGAANL